MTMTTATDRTRARTCRSTCAAAGWATALCLGSTATGIAVAHEAPAADRSSGELVRTDAHDQAQLAYDDGRWRAACERFAARADGGHAEAARIAWPMHRHGPALYRTRLAASDAQRDRWQQISAAAVPLPFRSASARAWQRAADADSGRVPAEVGAADNPRRSP